MKVKTALRIASYGAAIFGILACGYCAAVWFSARLYQKDEARAFDRALEIKSRTLVARSIPKPVLVPRDGAIMGKLEIPRLGLSVMVVEGASGADLERAAGHIPGTALPGQPGNVAIAAHRDTYFRPLAGIRLGDTIAMGTLEGTYNYRVSSTSIVRPDDVAVLDPTPQDTLTLVTCYPFHYVGAAPMRFIVRAVR